MKRTIRVNEESVDKPNTFEENFKIYLRVKPIIGTQERKQSVKIINKKKVEIVSPHYTTDPEKTYYYEEVFAPTIANEEVFQKTMIVPILNVLSGLNSTVFIYGMTGAGKTHTMFGN